MTSALGILRRERDDAAEQIRSLRVRIRDLEVAIGILEGQPASSPQGRVAGDLKQIVLSKLTEFAKNGGTPKEIADALTKQGRPTSDASVSSTLSRLKADGKVTNRAGRWFAANEPATENLAGSADSHINQKWDDMDDDVPF